MRHCNIAILCIYTYWDTIATKTTLFFQPFSFLDMSGRQEPSILIMHADELACGGSFGVCVRQQQLREKHVGLRIAIGFPHVH